MTGDLPVDTVEEVDDNDGRGFKRHFVEADNVTEVNGHLVELLRLYRSASFQLGYHLLR